MTSAFDPEGGGVTYRVQDLDPSTWELFAELVERNNGVYGGCWCIAYHLDRKTPGLDHRDAKQGLVRTGGAHAALVVDDEGLAQGWAQYGTPNELPGIRFRREYEKQPPPPPDWRLTCIFVDKRHRGQGVARAAVGGAMELIAARGGGVVEAMSETTLGREAHGRFLFSATAELLEQHGFHRDRQVGKHAWVMTAVVAAVRSE